MQFTMASIFFFFCAIAQCLAMSPLPRGATGNGNLVTLEIPHGHGANGTIVIDIEKANRYFLNEAGTDMNKLLDYLHRLPYPEDSAEYSFPAGSGLEDSSVTFYHDDIIKDKDVAVHGTQNSAQFDCNDCLIVCIGFVWFPPAFAVCMGACASKGCMPVRAI